MIIDVRAAQRMLLALGFHLGPAGADGQLGPATKAAVTAFQRSRGLVADGAIGPVTMRALEEAAEHGPQHLPLVTNSEVRVRGETFAGWFNTNLRLQFPALFPHRINETNFCTVFDQAGELGMGPGLTYPEFVAMVAIFYNETGGTLQSMSERGGLSYCFGTAGGAKASYNVARNGNRRAGDLLRARGVLTDDSAVLLWNGTEWPKPPPTDPQLLAALRECDFHKFRGRGLCQITWRAGYRAYVDPAIAAYGTTSEQLTNDQLDHLMASDPKVFCRATALYFHDPSWAGFVLPRVNDTPPDFYELGRRISGSTRYAELYEKRCLAILHMSAAHVDIG